MNDLILDFFDSTVNYKKLKRSRLKRKLTLNEVSEKTGIPVATLQRYEEGRTKKIPFEAVKKICEVYKTDYNFYYVWNFFPFFGTLAGALISLFYGFSLLNIQGGVTIGAALGFSSVFGFEKLYPKLKKGEKNFKSIIYSSLTPEEQKEYQDFKTIATTILKTNEILCDEEKEENDNLLFASFMLHKIRKNSKFKKINFEEAETIEDIKNS